jgi:hypothetical protein
MKHGTGSIFQFHMRRFAEETPHLPQKKTAVVLKQNVEWVPQIVFR